MNLVFQAILKRVLAQEPVYNHQKWVGQSSSMKLSLFGISVISETSENQEIKINVRTIYTMRPSHAIVCSDMYD